MVTKSKFSQISDRIKLKMESKGGFTLLDESEIYTGVCVGVTYAENVKSVFEGVEKTQDKLGYWFLVKHEGKWVPLRAEWTVSGADQAKVKPIMEKLGVNIEEFYTLLGKTVKIGIETKKSKKNKEYNVITKLLPSKTELEFEDTFELPFFYGTNEDAETFQFEVLDGITIGKEKKTREKLIKKIDSELSEDDETEEVLEDDEDDLDDFIDNM